MVDPSPSRAAKPPSALRDFLASEAAGGAVLIVAAMLALVPIRESPGAPDDATSPLHRLEHALHPWSAYCIVPLFAFANAGVALGGIADAIRQPLVLALIAGLFLGKQAGIFGAIWGATRLGIATRPAGSAGSRFGACRCWPGSASP